MSYLVLARKWRPQTFSDLIGQEHVSRTLKNAIDSGRVAHAFLFTGARGVGKTSSARILAKALNCEEGMSPEPCNVCPACIEITNGASVDVLEIDGASNTGVDDIRDLRETVKYLPSRCRYKIFIIDEVHMLSTNAFNALLKTLEEPPPHVKFIFATTEPHKLPITILSRCQRFDFKRIPLNKLVARLRYIVDREAVTISDASLSVISRKGDGSMRDSLSVLDQVLAFSSERIEDDEVISLLGVVDRRLLLDTTRAVFARDTRTVLEIIRKIDNFGYNMRQFCQELIEQFRNLTILRAVRDASDLLDLSETELEEIREQATTCELPELQRHLAILLKADSEMAQSSFPRLVLEMALIRMATLARVMPVDDILAQLKRLEGRLQGGVVADSPPQWTASRSASPERPVPTVREPAAPAREPHSQRPEPQSKTPPAEQPTAQRTGNDWADLVAYVKKKKVLLGSLLEHGSPLEVSAQTVRIGFAEDSFHLNRVKDQEMFNALKQLAHEFFKSDPAVSVIPIRIDSDNAPQSLLEKKKADEEHLMNSIRKTALSNPAISAALEVFGGEIAEVTELAQKIEDTPDMT